MVAKWKRLLETLAGCSLITSFRASRARICRLSLLFLFLSSYSSLSVWEHTIEYDGRIREVEALLKLRGHGSRVMTPGGTQSGVHDVLDSQLGFGKSPP